MKKIGVFLIIFLILFIPISFAKQIDVEGVTESERGEQAEALVQSSSVSEKNYIYGNNLIASVEGDKIRYHHQDIIHSNSIITDEDGGIVYEGYYLPFGYVFNSVGENDYGFSNKELDDTGLNYFVARYYDPKIGRFLQVDPLMDSYSYGYANNNPKKFVDPSGEFVITVPTIIAGLVAWGTAAASDPTFIFDLEDLITGLSTGDSLMFGLALFGVLAPGGISGQHAKAGKEAVEEAIQSKAAREILEESSQALKKEIDKLDDLIKRSSPEAQAAILKQKDKLMKKGIAGGSDFLTRKVARKGITSLLANNLDELNKPLKIKLKGVLESLPPGTNLEAINRRIRDFGLEATRKGSGEIGIFQGKKYVGSISSTPSDVSSRLNSASDILKKINWNQVPGFYNMGNIQRTVKNADFGQDIIFRDGRPFFQ